MKAQIAFYKAKGNLIDLLIRIWTNSPYSHCEIILNKDWYSSSPRDNGVRIKQISDSGNSLDYIEIDINKERLYELYRNNKNKGYDYKGIFFSNILGLKLHSKYKMSCSEFCAEVLGLDKPYMYSPCSLYIKLKGNKDEK